MPTTSVGTSAPASRTAFSSSFAKKISFQSVCRSFLKICKILARLLILVLLLEASALFLPGLREVMPNFYMFIDVIASCFDYAYQIALEGCASLYTAFSLIL